MNKKFMIIVSSMAFVFLVACFIFYSVSTNAMQKKLLGQTNTLHDLQNQIDVKQTESDSNNAMLSQNTTGLQAYRVTKDDKIAETFISSVLTWSDGATYDSMRLNAMDKYGLKDTDSFMKVFLPVNVKTADGKYNYIDTHHRNCKYESMSSYVSGIGSDVYSYFTFVTWSASDMGGNEAKSSCIFTYDINSNGDISNLNAYTMAN